MKKTLAFLLFAVLLVGMSFAVPPANGDIAQRVELIKLQASIRIIEVFKQMELTKEQATKIFEGLTEVREKLDSLLKQKEELLLELKKAMLEDDTAAIEKLREKLIANNRETFETLKGAQKVIKDNLTVTQMEKLMRMARDRVFDRLRNSPQFREMFINGLREKPLKDAPYIQERLKNFRDLSPQEKREWLERASNTPRIKNLVNQRIVADKALTRFILSPVFLDTLKEYAGIE